MQTDCKLVQTDVRVRESYNNFVQFVNCKHCDKRVYQVEESDNELLGQKPRHHLLLIRYKHVIVSFHKPH